MGRLIIAILFMSPGILVAEPSPWVDSMRQIVFPGTLDNGWSRGSSGLAIGIGGQNIQWNDDLIYEDQSWGREGPSEARQIKATVFGGSILPVSWGAVFSRVENSTISTISGHIRYTFLEERNIPSLALQAATGKVFGLKTTQARTDLVEAVGTWGYRFISLTLKSGVAKTQISTSFENKTKRIFLQSNRKDTDINHSEINPYYSIGLQLKPGPLSSITIESPQSIGKSGEIQYPVNLLLSIGI